MPRRVSLPGASELFRSTGGVEPEIGEVAVDGGRIDEAPTDEARAPAPAEPVRSPAAGEAETESAGVRGTGRVRHDEKITVYVSADELLALEQARLTIRARYRKAVDRGRIVRLAVAAALADFETNGADSELMRRLDPS